MKTSSLSILNVNFRDPEERARFREEQDILLAVRKEKIVDELKRNGQLDDAGNLIFKEPLPPDMQPDFLADCKH